MALSAEYSGPSYHALARSTLGNSRMTKRPAFQRFDLAAARQEFSAVLRDGCARPLSILPVGFGIGNFVIGDNIDCHDDLLVKVPWAGTRPAPTVAPHATCPYHSRGDPGGRPPYYSSVPFTCSSPSGAPCRLRRRWLWPLLWSAPSPRRS